MALGSAIEWTESTWNPVTGCNKMGPGCRHCYAERMAERLQAMGQPNYRNGFKLTLQPRALDLPLRWKKPQTIFVNSMSDLFHEDVPLEFIQRVFGVMRDAHWHRFQVLTKRAERLAAHDRQLDWAPNIWMGVSVETATYTRRIDELRGVGAVVKFLSLEPLLGPLPNLDLRGMDWVIVGGESGPKARPMDPVWVTDIRDQCIRAGVPFFFKQWGGRNKKKAGRLLEGQTWSQMPAVSAEKRPRDRGDGLEEGTMIWRRLDRPAEADESSSHRRERLKGTHGTNGSSEGRISRQTHSASALSPYDLPRPATMV